MRSILNSFLTIAIFTFAFSRAEKSDDWRTFLGHGSSLELNTFKWTANDELSIRFSFQTRSYQGQLFRVIATNEQRENVLEIRVWIARRTARIYVEDFVDEQDLISTLHFPDIGFGSCNWSETSCDPSDVSS